MEKLYELIIDNEETDEVMCISLVESPAIEEPFMYFDKEEVMFAAVDNEQQMLIGPILVPDKKILRIDGEGQPYHVFFSKETVKKLAQNYLMKKYNSNATLEHDKNINGKVHLVESWIKEGKLDKSNSYGISAVDGTWMGMFKITDPKIWNEYVKTGKVTGFSVEALMEHRLVKASKSLWAKEVTELSEQEADIFLSTLKAIIKKDKRFKKKERIEFESYSDYPDGVKNNAKRALEWADKNGWGSCGTPVGKQRANQLAKGEAISVETIRRMFSFLSRHEKDLQSSTAYGDGCGKLMYDAWGGRAGLGWSRNKLRTLGLLTEAEAQPSFPGGSSYPGEVASGSVAPALLVEETELCPEATYNIELNLKNRQTAIDVADYGPLNPNEPNEEYWKSKAEMFKGDLESAKKALCGNCAFFLQTKNILNCIAEGIGGEVKDEWDTIEAGNLGYCEAFDFKCAANRTCNAWVVGGPITD